MRMRRMIPFVVGITLGLATPSPARTLGERRKAAWLSVGHPGLGEYYNAGWGDFFEKCPQKKFWLGMIPFYGWPGYLQVLSAIDAYHGRTSDNLRPIDQTLAGRLKEHHLTVLREPKDEGQGIEAFVAEPDAGRG